MDLRLTHSGTIPDQRILISGSKSETNRMLLLLCLYPNIVLGNISDSDDSKAMANGLTSQSEIIDVHHAGTAMRFLTAFFAIQQDREVVLTGSERMKQRPIKILVDALRELGAEISYLGNEGFPPLKICGKKLSKDQISLPANVSSQYVSALLLIASKLENGLELALDGEITSAPYIKMTLALLNQIGIKTTFENNTITVFPKTQVEAIKIFSESDWSSASYFYSIIALSEIGSQLSLTCFRSDSFQGDSALMGIYENFGVSTTFIENRIMLRKETLNLEPCTLNLNHTPDIAQTIAVNCFGLGLECHLTGLHTLKIKETDRLIALQNELTKLGAKVLVTNDSLTLEASTAIHPNIKIETYNDHRMAMAFAPLALKVPIVIEDAEVVSKSYSNFWNDLKNIGFEIKMV